MAAVRLTAYSGIIAVPWAANNQLATNAAYVFKEPYLATVTINTTGSPQSSSPALSADKGTRVLRVEVQRGSVMQYRVNLPNLTAVPVTQDDPTLDGKDNIDFGPGYTISIMDAGSEA